MTDLVDEGRAVDIAYLDFGRPLTPTSVWGADDTQAGGADSEAGWKLSEWLGPEGPDCWPYLVGDQWLAVYPRSQY